jgi:hypothetical protein
MATDNNKDKESFLNLDCKNARYNLVVPETPVMSQKKQRQMRRYRKKRVILVSKNNLVRLNFEFEEKLKKVLNPIKIERIINKKNKFVLG